MIKILNAHSFFVLLLLLLNGCTEEKMEEHKTLIINYNQPYEVFLEKNTPIMRKSGGGSKKSGYMFFHEINWSPRDDAQVVIKLGDSDVMLSHAIYFMATVDMNDVDAGDGVNDFYIQAGITAEDWITYDEARLKFHAMLQRLLDKGWKKSLMYSSPRFVLNDATEYKLSASDYGSQYYYAMDSRYLPTLEQWKAFPSDGNIWKLQLNNEVFMEIELNVTPHKTEPNKASYLLFFRIQNKVNEARNYFDQEDKLTWKENWLITKKEYLKMRQKAEIEGIIKGYDIDVHYLDYQIPPGAIKTQQQLDEEVTALTFKIGEIAPRSGYYEATLPVGNTQYETLKANPQRYVEYKKGEAFVTLGFGETTESKLRWVWIVDSLPDSSTGDSL